MLISNLPVAYTYIMYFQLIFMSTFYDVDITRAPTSNRLRLRLKLPLILFLLPYYVNMHERAGIVFF